MQPSKFGHMGHIGKNVLLWPADLKLQGFGQIDLALPRPGKWWRCVSVILPLLLNKCYCYP